MGSNVLVVILVSAAVSVLVSFATNFYFKKKHNAKISEIQDEVENQKFVITETMSSINEQNNNIRESLVAIRDFMKEKLNSN